MAYRVLDNRVAPQVPYCTPNPDLSEFYCAKSLCDASPELCKDDEYYSDDDEDPDDAQWPLLPNDGGHDDGHDELWVAGPADPSVARVLRILQPISPTIRTV